MTVKNPIHKNIKSCVDILRDYVWSHGMMRLPIFPIHFSEAFMVVNSSLLFHVSVLCVQSDSQFRAQLWQSRYSGWARRNIDVLYLERSNGEYSYPHPNHNIQTHTHTHTFLNLLVLLLHAKHIHCFFHYSNHKEGLDFCAHSNSRHVPGLLHLPNRWWARSSNPSIYFLTLPLLWITVLSQCMRAASDSPDAQHTSTLFMVNVTVWSASMETELLWWGNGKCRWQEVIQHIRQDTKHRCVHTSLLTSHCGLLIQQDVQWHYFTLIFFIYPQQDGANLLGLSFSHCG